MRLAVNLTLSFGMLALCVWLVWPDAITRAQLEVAFRALRWDDFAPYLAAFFGLQTIVHLCRSLRWNHLLAPLGVRIPPGPLLAISSVGFMAILALPARLGEVVRPSLLRKRGVSAAAALGTVAVERVVDGLLISLFVFGAFFSLRGEHAPPWMMPTAYAALGVFASAMVFLVFAMRRPEATVRFCLRISLAYRLAPRVAAVLESKLLDMIRGLVVLKDVRNMLAFLAWSLVYWGANGLGVWVLARAFGLELSVIGGFATMGLVAVGVSLPNSPGLVGQFQWFTLLGLSVYLGVDAKTEHTALYASTFAFANVHYLSQVVWYVGMGMLGIATPWVSWGDLRRERAPEVPVQKLAPAPEDSDDPGDVAEPPPPAAVGSG